MKTMSFGIQCCCICGLMNCQQSTDHERISVTQLKEIIMKNKSNNSEIDDMKFSVRKKFFKLKKEVIEMIQKKEKSIIGWLDSFYFQHLQDQLKHRSISILCDIFQNDLKQLPNKEVKKIVKTLEKENNKKNNKIQVPIGSIKQDINEVLKSIEIPKILQELNNSLKTQQLGSFSKPQNKLSKSTDSVKTCHSASSTINKQFQPQLITPVQSYEWKHIKITHTLKTLELNNRNITDPDMIKQIPIISTFTNLKQLQIRNNKITSLSCSLIANQMKFLTMIDIRGNKVGDDGIQKIVINMNNLKALYISETGITDNTGNLIAKFLPDLQTLWAEHNQMTGESCIKISQKPKLRLLSLINNPINQQHKTFIQSIFRSKGYLNI